MVEHLDGVFHALAHPARRQLVSTLADDGPQPIGNLAAPFEMSFQAVSKHIGVLEDAGLVSRTREGRAHRIALRATPLADAAAWLSHYRRFWRGAMESLDAHLKENP